MFIRKFDDGKSMTDQSTKASEQVFSKLCDYGYSEKVAESIWRWYHPSYKAATGF